MYMYICAYITSSFFDIMVFLGWTEEMFMLCLVKILLIIKNISKRPKIISYLKVTIDNNEALYLSLKTELSFI